MKKRIINTISITIFTIIFIYGITSLIYSRQYEIIDLEHSLNFSYKYYLIPSLILSSHLSYIAAFRYKKGLKKWFKIISFPVFLIPIMLVCISCFWSISIFLNEKVGQQDLVIVKSKIIELEKTSDNSISYITLENQSGTIKLRIDEKVYNKYHEKTIFNETLWKGSFDFYYWKE
jgi:hypothetical protein